MADLHLDWETRGVLDLREVGLYNYSRDKNTDIWCGGYSFGNEEPQIWTPGQPCPARIVDHIKSGGKVLAWNAPFEIALWIAIATPRYGWPELRPEQAFCVMARSYAMGLPGALEDAALAAGIHVLKDAEGRSLMLRMCRPRSKPGQPLVWWDEPEKLARLYAYCKQDVRVERALAERLMPLSDKERRVWLMDYRINQRGIKVDVETAKAAVDLAAKVKETCDAELARVTGDMVLAATAVGALKDWIATRGVEITALAKQDVVDLLETGGLPDDVRRALTLRQEAGKASTAKLERMVNLAGPDGRIRNILQYHGAATGRWAARGVQVHNLPRDVPPQKTLEKMLGLVRAGKMADIDLLYGPPMSVLSRCLRGFFIPEEGKVLVPGDFANVEGRGVAWFSGEQWKLDAFRAADAGTGPGLYELAYAKSFHVPVESVKNPSFERQVGKVMELAFGYQGGVGAFKTMGRVLGVQVSDEDADKFKNAWREAHPRVKNTWYELQRSAISAVENPGSIFEAGYPGRQAKFKVAGSFLWCLLPSGRALCYPYPKILEGRFGPQLTYMTSPSPDDKKKGRIIDDPHNSSNWARVGTYGGSLMENIIQAICRDLLVDVMLQLDEMGAAIVLHVHDEPVIEVAREKAEGARAKMQEIMRTAPAWAAGFPLWADCKIMGRYGK